MTKEIISDWFKTLQQKICVALETADGQASFISDAWDRPGGGGGTTRVISEGRIIEKGGVNFSAVWGKTPSAVVQSLQIAPGDHPDFFATGVSIVIHPNNPHVPIIHMNVRYFEMTNGMYWFGGGIDLTPHYLNKEDARFFHRTLKDVCDNHNPVYYPEFRKWADDYFFLKHRNETRGVGGIFFDHLKATDTVSKEMLFKFVQDVGLTFAPVYTALIKKNHQQPFSEEQKSWQYHRRGRYVEFNLVWDRGTKFGLDTDGRTESILMSLPPMAMWTYRHEPASGSNEAVTLQYLRKGVDWINE